MNAEATLAPDIPAGMSLLRMEVSVVPDGTVGVDSSRGPSTPLRTEGDGLPREEDYIEVLTRKLARVMKRVEYWEKRLSPGAWEILRTLMDDREFFPYEVVSGEAEKVVDELARMARRLDV